MADVFYITTPIYYVNDVPHIGHAYSTVAADVLARYHRLRGDDTFFLTGTDEHGQKVARAAEERGLDPQSWSDSMIPPWKAVWERLLISNDDFIRTTESRHVERVQVLWNRLVEAGDVYSDTYEGPYCVACEAFYTEEELTGGNCPIHGRPVEVVREENYFFRLSKYQGWLLDDYYRRTPPSVQPVERLNEVIGFVRQGLQDLSISRTSFSWGVPVPGDPKHVIYVWVDALPNYITALGYPDGEKFTRYWPAVHLVGKDILRFHSVIWPAICHAAGIEPPRLVFAHGWLLVGGEKMSKTKLTGIHPDQLLDVFGPDAYRYYFMREIAFGQDGSFSWESMVARYNAELANGLGNLANRVVAMIASYFGGDVPEPTGAAGEPERAMEETVARSAEAYGRAMDALAPHEALEAVDAIVRRANGYLVEREPWKRVKDPAARDEVARVLWTAAETLRVTAVLLAPFMPRACGRLWEMLGAPGAVDSQRLPDAARWGGLPAGVRVSKGEALFPRIETDATADADR